MKKLLGTILVTFAALVPSTPLPAACANTCNSLQGHACSTEGQHFFCTVGCRTWGCTCMGGAIECGLP
jgi:hypothetical protein